MAQARTGGTLLTTMLDAHPSCAMSYEIYPELLVGPDGGILEPRHVAEALEGAEAVDTVAWVRGADLGSRFEAFCFRARRGGLDVPDIVAELRAHDEDGGQLDALDNRLDFIERLQRRAARLRGVRRWGGKARTDPDVLLRRHADARLLYMVRDGRDVLSSRLNTGSFDQSATAVAHEWMDHLDRMSVARTEHPGRVLAVPYEQLVERPTVWTRRVCDFIGEPWSPSMIQFHEHDLSLWHAPHGHLSADQLRSGLNRSSVGRWRTELGPSVRAEFEALAGGHLEGHGYGDVEFF